MSNILLKINLVHKVIKIFHLRERWQGSVRVLRWLRTEHADRRTRRVTWNDLDEVWQTFECREQRPSSEVPCPQRPTRPARKWCGSLPWRARAVRKERTPQRTKSCERPRQEYVDRGGSRRSTARREWSPCRGPARHSPLKRWRRSMAQRWSCCCDAWRSSWSTRGKCDRRTVGWCRTTWNSNLGLTFSYKWTLGVKTYFLFRVQFYRHLNPAKTWNFLFLLRFVSSRIW